MTTFAVLDNPDRTLRKWSEGWLSPVARWQRWRLAHTKNSKLIDKILCNDVLTLHKVRWLMGNPYLSKSQYLDLLAFAGYLDEFWRANFVRNAGIPEEILADLAINDSSALVRGSIAKYSHASEETKVMAALMGTQDFHDYLKQYPKGHPDAIKHNEDHENVVGAFWTAVFVLLMIFALIYVAVFRNSVPADGSPSHLKVSVQQSLALATPQGVTP